LRDVFNDVNLWVAFNQPPYMYDESISTKLTVNF